MAASLSGKEIIVIEYYKKNPRTQLKVASDELKISSANIRYYLIKHKIDLPITSTEKKTSHKTKKQSKSTTLDDMLGSSESSEPENSEEVVMEKHPAYEFKSHEEAGVCPKCTKPVAFMAKAAELTGSGSYKIKHFGECSHCKTYTVYTK